MNNTIKAVCVFTLFFIQEIEAQNASPYSYFGIGTVNNVDNSRNIALGNTGIALEAPDYINTKNPASINTIGNYNVIYDVSGLMKYNTITSNQGTDSRFNSNFTNLGIAMRISNRVSIGASVQPTTATDYKFVSTFPVEGTSENYPITYEGSGGITNLGVTLGYKFNNNWSIGAKAKNNFGTISRVETITTTSELEINRNVRYTGFSYGLGTQFSKYFPTKKLQMVVGAIVNFKSDLNAKGEVIYTENKDYTNSVTSALSTKSTTLPLEIGFGASILKNDRYRFSFDYTNSQWGKVTNTVTNEKYYDQNVYGLGFELLPYKKSTPTLGESMIYRFGVNYDTGYYQVKGRDINKLELTAGLGIPLNKIVLNLGYGFGRRGVFEAAAIKENYHMLNISVNFLDNWFTKRYIN